MLMAHTIRWLPVLALFTASCAGTSVPTESPTTASTEAEAQPTATEAPPHPSWVELRDAAFGHGISLPSWWTVIPTPGQGVIATMTIQSYDEAFFNANSARGVWVGGHYPEGAFKMDWIGVTQMDPALTTQAALEPLLQNDTQEIVSAEEVQVSRQTASSQLEPGAWSLMPARLRAGA